MPQKMKAWWVHRSSPIADGPLAFGEREDPVPGAREIRVRVSVCGVCRTDLHLAEGDLPAHRPDTVPGHEIVGVVDRVGPQATRFPVGARVGIAWLRHTCGICRFCRRGAENLCIDPRFTGWDADGGFAELAVVDERYAYPLPDSFDDDSAAPLLCAGIIGYRALRRAALPRGGRLGIYGYGASAHLAAQVALHEGAEVHVLTRSAEARQLALELGASSAADAYDAPPQPLDAAILFAPVGDLVPVALRALDRGGTLAIAGIHLTDIPTLDYATDLFQERQVRSVTANTRRDGEEFLALAARIPIRPTVTGYPLSGVVAALADVAGDRLTGAAVIKIGPESRSKRTE
jgi:propanol-preferring alcohol dehydrogenase